MEMKISTNKYLLCLTLVKQIKKVQPQRVTPTRTISPTPNRTTSNANLFQIR